MSEHSEIRDRLLGQRAELAQRLERTQAEEREEVSEGEDDSTAQLREASEIRDGLNDHAATELAEIDRALSRLDYGTYGSCVECGKEIDQRRLEALPYASLCITCAERA